jgi:hypothetical protein
MAFDKVSNVSMIVLEDVLTAPVALAVAAALEPESAPVPEPPVDDAPPAPARAALKWLVTPSHLSGG